MTRTIFELNEVRNRLTELGISFEALQGAMQASYKAFHSCGNLDAPSFKGTLGWNTALVMMRVKLQESRAWSIRNVQNFCLTENSTKKIAIAVLSGNKHTGIPNLELGVQPSPKGKVGTFREASAVKNSLQYELFEEADAVSLADVEVRQAFNKLDGDIWFFLINNYGKNPKAELSLPEMDKSGQVLSWQERIIIPNDKDGELDFKKPESLPEDDLGIEVTFKTNV